MFRVTRVMRASEDPRAAPEDMCWEMIGEGTYVDSNATLESAMPLLEATDVPFVPVVLTRTEGDPPELLGALFHVDALRAYNQALAATAAEEHS